MMKIIFFSAFVLLLFIHFNFTITIAQIIPDFQVNENAGINGADQYYPSIATDGSGNFIVTWTDDRNGTDFDIFAQFLSSDGTALGSNFKVNDDQETAIQYSPEIAIDHNLNFVITWLDRRNNSNWDIYAQRFANDGTPLGSNFKVNDDIGNVEHERVSVSIDSNGNFVIVWADKRNGNWDIYAQRYEYNGTPLGGNFKVNDDSGNSAQYWNDISLDAEGNFIITWADLRNGTSYFYDIYFQKYSNNGTPIGNNVKVNDNIVNSLQFYPSVAMNNSGDFIITWTDERNGDRDIYAQRYLNDGSPIGSNFIVYPDTTGTDQALPSIATDGAGNFIITWNDNRNDYGDIYARCFSVDGVPIGNDFKVNDDPGNTTQWVPSVAAGINGNFIITWEDYRNGYSGDVYAQSYISGGTTVGGNYLVNDDAGSSDQSEPSIAIDGCGNFLVTWTDERNGDQDIYAQRYSSEGTALGNNFLVNHDQGDATHNSPSITADVNGNFVITWSDFRSGYLSDIYAQRYSADGTALGGNFKVNEDSGFVYHYAPDIASDENGNFIITWFDGSDSKSNQSYQEVLNEGKTLKNNVSVNSNTEPDIYAQRYLNDGTPLGSNFKVNDDSVYALQDCPSITIDGNGNFVIAWQDERNGDWDIYFQRYNSDGTPLGNNSRVEDSTASEYQWNPSISSDGDGNFIISWQDRRNGDFDIYAQRYLSDGTALGSNFKVNDESINAHHSSPDISVDGSGKFIITWTDNRNGGQDIFSQRFLGNGTAYGNNFRVTNTSDEFQLLPAVTTMNDKIFTVWQDNRNGQTGFDIWANVLDWENIVSAGNNNLSEIPSGYYLYQNYPNPFNPGTNISWQSPVGSWQTLKVFDVLGNEIATLIDEYKPAGRYKVEFFTASLTSGVYFYQLRAGKFVETKKMIFLK
jgi:predicted 3-demethylubiquinone-9 3-methyltransferase (glyoxalase superfamily)